MRYEIWHRDNLYGWVLIDETDSRDKVDVFRLRPGWRVFDTELNEWVI